MELVLDTYFSTFWKICLVFFNMNTVTEQE